MAFPVSALLGSAPPSKKDNGELAMVSRAWLSPMSSESSGQRLLLGDSKHLGADEMAQASPASKPEDLTLTPRACVVEGSGLWGKPRKLTSEMKPGV